MLKIMRIFAGGYSPDYSKLKNLGYQILKLQMPFFTVVNSDQGFGQIKGSTKKLNVIYPGVEVCVFKRSNKQLLWTTLSKSDGSYAFRNLAVGLECFVTAFDPKREYNAVIADGVKAK
ncbi:carboxypeptidase regulatory-like domain-containing protein [Acinetobacter guillouiae]|uniref:carboxypeptidase regulatory-like domain-containing protein n=1 Tax=Acinetobacter guillouiae TaxID=106649 RepID=UPI001CD238A2|nr:carboxypeptidase regulatory-like domain-containing protein [Acinetobacter guillouiae]